MEMTIIKNAVFLAEMRSRFVPPAPHLRQDRSKLTEVSLRTGEQCQKSLLQKKKQESKDVFKQTDAEGGLAVVKILWDCS